VLALFGAGAQAPHQVHAVCAVRPIERIWIVNRGRERAEALRLTLQDQGIQAEIGLAESAAAALAEADVICCATRAATPLFADADLRPGTHINGVGSYTHELAEVPPTTVGRARVVVDQRAAAWAEAGDLIQARDAGLLDADSIAELGEVLAGQAAGRSNAEQITFFKSVGNAVQDMAVGQLALAEARRLGLGTEVPL
jgi:ornithine cyclodeaminase